MIVYTFDFTTASVLERTCEDFGYPNKDSTGQTQFENSHFATYKEALTKLRAEVEASIALGSRERQRVSATLSRLTSDLASDAERLAHVMDLERQLERPPKATSVLDTADLVIEEGVAREMVAMQLAERLILIDKFLADTALTPRERARAEKAAGAFRKQLQDLNVSADFLRAAAKTCATACEDSP